MFPQSGSIVAWSFHSVTCDCLQPSEGHRGVASWTDHQFSTSPQSDTHCGWLAWLWYFWTVRVSKKILIKLGLVCMSLNHRWIWTNTSVIKSNCAVNCIYSVLPKYLQPLNFPTVCYVTLRPQTSLYLIGKKSWNIFCCCFFVCICFQSHQVN